MAILIDSIGASTTSRRRRWEDRDSLLYAIGVGAGTDDLAFVTENTHNVPRRVLPTFAVVVCNPHAALKLVGDVPLHQLLHGSQSVRLHQPLPQSGELEVTATVKGLVDKGPGKHAYITLGAEGRHPEEGSLLVETESTLVVRGGGGFGGPGGKVPALPPMRSDPNHEVAYQTRVEQALIYRLSGDRNPLHSDPWFAREHAGFARPILHGLSSYGFAGRAVLATLCDDDPARFRSISARFSAPVFPGELLTTKIWRIDESTARFTTMARDGGGLEHRTVLADGVAEVTPNPPQAHEPDAGR